MLNKYSRLRAAARLTVAESDREPDVTIGNSGRDAPLRRDRDERQDA